MLKSINRRKFLSASILLLALLVLFTTCDNIIGLGNKVNTEKPIISMPGDNNGPGAFLHGAGNRIELQVDQPFGVETVYMEVYYDGGFINLPAVFDKAKGVWYVDLDVSKMPDGQITTRAVATDISGNTTITTDIVYYVKNTPPQIELTLPKIKGDEFDYYYVTGNKFDSLNPARGGLNHPDFIEYRRMYQGSDLMGIASDFLGIEHGYPEVKFWPRDLYPNGEPPITDLKWGQWRSAVDDKGRPLEEDGLKALQFRWPLVKLVPSTAGTWRLPVGNEIEDLDPDYYRFKIRVMDKFPKSPENVYPDRTDYNDKIVTDKSNQNQYIEIRLVASDNPTFRWQDAIPDVYNGFPDYYNGEGNFIAILRITGKNDITRVRARVSNNENPGWSYNDDEWEKADIDAVIRHPDDANGFNFVNSYTISIPYSRIPDPSQPEKVLHVEAKDNVGNAATTSKSFILDNTPPELKFIAPDGLNAVRLFPEQTPAPAVPEPPDVTSTVIIRGSATDTQGLVKKMYYALGKTEFAATKNDSSPMVKPEDGWTDTLLDTRTPMNSNPGLDAVWSDTLSSWSWRFNNIADLCDDYYATNFTANLWKLPIKFKLVDAAQNVSVYSAELILNPDRDIPQVTITSHNDRQIVGGRIVLAGTATDNEWIHSVEVRVTAQSDADAAANKPFNPKPSGSFTTAAIKGNNSSTVNWEYVLNGDDKLTLDNGRREVLVEVRPRDAHMDTKAAKQYGPTEMIFLSFDSGVPEIRDISIIYGKYSDYIDTTKTVEVVNYDTGKVISGEVTVMATIRDDHEIKNVKLRGFKAIEILIEFKNYPQLTRLTDPQTITTSDGIIIRPEGIKTVGSGSKKHYRIFIPLDTTLRSSGVFNMELEVEDQNTTPESYRTQSTISLVIDRDKPKLEFIQPQGLGPTETPEVTGTVIIRGSATDNQQVAKMYYALGRTETNATLGDAWNDNTGWTDTLLDTALPLNNHKGINAVWSDNFTSWRWRINNVKDLSNASYATAYTDPSDPGRANLWKLPIKFKVVDAARNVEIVTVEMILDPDRDIPTLEISNPANGQVLGGAVRISGTAEDNEWIHSVEIRITRQNNTAAAAGLSFASTPAGQIEAVTTSSNDNFIPATITGSGTNVSWFYNLAEQPYPGGKREVKVEVRPRDAYFDLALKTPKQYGKTESIIIAFAPGVPEVTDIKIIQGIYTNYLVIPPSGIVTDWTPGKLISGDVTFMALLRDDDDIKNFKLRGWTSDVEFNLSSNLTNNVPPKVETINGITIKSEGSIAGKKQYRVFIPLAKTDKPDGLLNLDIEVEDTTSPMPYRGMSTISVILDNTPPGLVFVQPLQWRTEPAGLPQESSTVVIKGSATDNQQVDKLYYALGVRETSNPALDVTTGGSAGWTDSGLGSTPRTTHPNIGLSGSPAYTPVGSEWADDLQSWSWTFADIGNFCNGASGITGNYYVRSSDPFSNPYNLWDLPIKFKVVDKAGNFKIVDRTLRLDPDKDRPRVFISSHKDNAVVGGMITVNGTAEDNDWVHSIEIRVSKKLSSGLPEYITDGGGSNFVKIGEPDGDPRGSMSNPSSTVSWRYTLNSDHSLTPISGQQEVLVEVRARDAYSFDIDNAKPLPGVPVNLTLFFDPGVPSISDIKIIHGKYSEYIAASPPLVVDNYLGGTSRVSGFITLMAKVSDDSDISSIRLGSRVGTGWDLTNYLNQTTPSDVNPFVEYIGGRGDPDVPTEYMIYIPLDTMGTLGGVNHGLDGLSGTFNLDIEAIDNSETKFQTQYTFSVLIDNFYPMASFESLHTAKGDYEIHGYAWDSAVNNARVQGINSVVLYFSKPGAENLGLGKFVDLNGVERTGTQYIVNDQVARRNRTGTVPTPTVQSTIINQGDHPAALPFFPKVWNTNREIFESTVNGIVIDADHDMSGGTIKEWSIGFDSSRLPDGPYILHYVVFDTVGNATHYSEEIIIANKRPEISRVWLGTDSNDNGVTTDAGETLPYPRNVGDPIGFKEIAPTDFRVQNSKLELRIDAKPGTGNGQKRYEVYYANRGTAQAQALVPGNVYTISEPGNIEWFNYGAPEFQTNKANYRDIIFVASKAMPAADMTAGSATVRAYTRPAGLAGTATLASGVFSTDSASGIQFGFTGATATAFDYIADSPEIDVVGGRIVWRNTGNGARYFIIHVYDTTVSGGTKDTQLAQVALFNIGITNEDLLAPSIAFLPFGKKIVMDTLNPNNYFLRTMNTDTPASEYNQNIVTASDGTRKGYVQYAAGQLRPVPSNASQVTSFVRPHISGMVIFKGKAMDNGQVARITAEIPGYNGGAEFNIATLSGGSLISAGSTIAAMRTSDVIPWGFETESPVVTMEYGHVLNWNFAWDSSTVANAVGNNIPVTFKAYDAEGNESVPATVIVNIVPYITEVITPLNGAMSSNPSTFSRSANGWYPLREGQEITIKGFNLAGSGATTSVAVNGTALTGVSTTKTQITGSINAAATSGELLVTITPTGAGAPPAVTSFNNRNYNRAPYNQEPNGINNNILTDDRNIYVWRVGSMWSDAAEFPFLNPVMRMDRASNWYMSYGGSTTSNGELWTVINGTRTEATNALNRWRHSTVAFDTRGGIFTIGANQTAATTDWRFCYRLARDNGTLNNFSNVGLTAAGGDRFMLPRIATQQAGSATINDTNNRIRILLSYFDTVDNTNNRLYFHYGTAWTSGGTGGTSGSTNNIAMGTAVEVANNSQTHNGSMFTAVGFLSTGRPVIAWYDRTNMNLVLSYGNGVPANNGAATVATTIGQWQANAKIVHRLAGSHVDMVIDQDNYVHLAYYDVLNGGLYYALIPTTGSGDGMIPDVSSASIVRVDTYLSAGTKIMLNVRRQGALNVPYITYFHGSFSETKNSIRVAWRSDFSLDNGKMKPGSDEYDRFTGAWEVMTVPATNVPASGELITNGVPTSGTFNGTSTTTLNGSNLTGTILVGYLTTNNYEGAILKDDIVNRKF